MRKNGVDLVGVAYTYNKKEVRTFIVTRGAGTTRHGELYEARFPNKFGNVCVRHVARPEVISNYFLYSNVVDLHNQGRYFNLSLENSGLLKILVFAYITMVIVNMIDS